MKDSYDFSKGVKNPYSKKLKKQITIRIDSESIDYFKKQAAEVGISYQNLINLYGSLQKGVGFEFIGTSH